MTSSTFLLETIFKAISKALFRTSMSGLERTRRISITRSSSTPSCSSCNSLTFSSTISLTLLSDSLIANSINFPADATVSNLYFRQIPFIAAGLLVSPAREIAASYPTVFEFDSNRSKINLKYLALFAGFNTASF